MNEAYVLLNVDYKQQRSIVEQATKIPSVKSVKTVYGIYDILIILESENMQEIKNAIDVHLHNIAGISNLTSLISVT
ncbi:MAG TPA: Lrp/AsnC ligand binding domain-containing protein [Candidatus Nitrosotenuis sp.]|nr:Lrp/AsnC ligand binding domain-containing protein [Candidatus Nitrosotenuis sp.]